MANSIIGMNPPLNVYAAAPSGAQPPSAAIPQVSSSSLQALPDQVPPAPSSMLQQSLASLSSSSASSSGAIVKSTPPTIDDDGVILLESAEAPKPTYWVLTTPPASVVRSEPKKYENQYDLLFPSSSRSSGAASKPAKLEFTDRGWERYYGVDVPKIETPPTIADILRAIERDLAATPVTYTRRQETSEGDKIVVGGFKASNVHIPASSDDEEMPGLIDEIDE